MIKLMHVNDYIIDTSQFKPLLSDKIVEEFEQRVAEYVGAKYACSIHSATMAIFMCLSYLCDYLNPRPPALRERRHPLRGLH